MSDLYAAIRERLGAYVDEGCGYSGHDCRVTGHDEMKAALLAVLERHKPDQWGNCSECREGGPGYEAEGVRAPCPSVKDIAEALEVQT